MKLRTLAVAALSALVALALCAPAFAGTKLQTGTKTQIKDGSCTR